MSNVVAFLQNMWVRDPVRARESLERYGQAWWRKATMLFLFGGVSKCVTGRRLEAAFGKELCRSITWEESTREIAGDPKTIFPADPEHIRAVLDELNPRVVLTFGRIANAAVKPLWAGEIITASHPAARHADVAKELGHAAERLRAIIYPRARDI